MEIQASCLAPTRKENVHRDVTDALNQDPLFDGCLKESTTRDKFQDAVKEANSIIQKGEKGHIKRAQNGGDAMSEIDELYLQLSRMKRRWEQKCNQQQAIANAEEEDTNTRFQAVMNTVQKRVSTNMPQFDYVTVGENASDAFKSADSGSPGTSSQISSVIADEAVNEDEPDKEVNEGLCDAIEVHVRRN
ncbi:hypothetical protein GUITHDRAFT_106256 [Guillardia theta CCMP2712]|uniref:Uncharacterized protein n=1 Tax=Guillardia theta (strain CCMP2712) TaxID=905079 RepID=L1JI52_GUITC|nr:hypothetical protein GUITHDRAFT_106256 [Guillardia theta CCMP2712]EKX48181.1 hypothetical protein GUITHDRAFT_106256 [Guillardia theta CCMP2712]|eukprot:XP_005835161.1 hypothetical protein GUITHDRAFT_106256 [Guillardia theta CCMP2712]